MLGYLHFLLYFFCTCCIYYCGETWTTNARQKKRPSAICLQLSLLEEQGYWCWSALKFGSSIRLPNHFSASCKGMVISRVGSFIVCPLATHATVVFTFIYILLPFELFDLIRSSTWMPGGSQGRAPPQNCIHSYIACQVEAFQRIVTMTNGNRKYGRPWCDSKMCASMTRPCYR